MATCRMVARPAGFANIAPASPTSAAPAPPSPADRVEPGRLLSTLPSDCPASSVTTKTSRNSVKEQRRGKM